MSGAKRLLIDANIVVLAIGGNFRLRQHLNKFQLHISIIAEIELLSIPFRDAEHELLLRDFIKRCLVIDISEDIKEMAAQIRKEWRAKLPDAIIAASAVVDDLEFLSADRGFNRIKLPAFKVLFYPN